ncbi:ABC transporter ATP-binding protein [Fimbriimonas ginsengisoli]|uniref:ABC transporter, ATP-binding protein n=1 Tax=Fimbriimonas ginsengisoli Gsoil 348 TaxID=661478 RepID=A0A068NKF7_FIMGI|nr:ABC transporter ATP-binding protein [Fimbriimonas ginsengisoli]AIE83927.1 ABC transporter, ATP-binding protein [Fimbriimonas ginsengisoli Gsoil 348]
MLEVKNLRKEYAGLTAVKGVSFNLQPGDIFGFIGSNGAGKTTTIRMISTLLEPTSGTAILNGADIRKDPMEVRRMLGYMPDFFGLYDDVKVWEYLDFFAAIYQVPTRQRSEVIDNVLELTDLTVKKDAFVQSLSRGMQQRLCLARCLVHDPMLLLLDEPASGLDPRARAELKELIAELGRMGKIVIVSSHILPELADFCNTVGIIERGELLAFGPVESIVQAMQPNRTLEARFLRDAGEAARIIRDMENVLSAEATGDGEVRIDYGGDHEAQADLLAELVRRGFRVVGFREDQADLEDVFLKLTTGAVN